MNRKDLKGYGISSERYEYKDFETEKPEKFCYVMLLMPDGSEIKASTSTWSCPDNIFYVKGERVELGPKQWKYRQESWL